MQEAGGDTSMMGQSGSSVGNLGIFELNVLPISMLLKMQ